MPPCMLLSPPHHAVHEPAENVQPAPAQELLDSRVAFLVLRARLGHDDAEAGGIDVLQHKRLCALHLRHGGFRRWKRTVDPHDTQMACGPRLAGAGLRLLAGPLASHVRRGRVTQ